MKRSKVVAILDAVLDGLRGEDGVIPEPPLVRVEWHDTFSSTEPGWSDHGDMVERSADPMLVVSVGFFRHSNSSHVVLVANQCALNGLHFGEVHIPFGMIQKVVVL